MAFLPRLTTYVSVLDGTLLGQSRANRPSKGQRTCRRTLDKSVCDRVCRRLAFVLKSGSRKGRVGSTPTPGTPTRFASCRAGGRARSLDHRRYANLATMKDDVPENRRGSVPKPTTQRFFVVLRPAVLRAVFSAFEVFAMSARWARSYVWMSLKRPLASRRRRASCPCYCDELCAVPSPWNLQLARILCEPVVRRYAISPRGNMGQTDTVSCG